jgi:hypothetical protein
MLTPSIAGPPAAGLSRPNRTRHGCENQTARPQARHATNASRHPEADTLPLVPHLHAFPRPQHSTPADAAHPLDPLVPAAYNSCADPRGQRVRPTQPEAVDRRTTTPRLAQGRRDALLGISELGESRNKTRGTPNPGGGVR